MSRSNVRRRAANRQASRRESVALAPRPALTGRAVVLALVIALVIFTLAVPVRNLVSQRAEISAARDANAATQQQLDELTAEQRRLEDPAYVESLIRDRLHYVKPGETAYTVIEKSPDRPTSPGEAPAGSSWYEKVWSSVQEADGVPAQAVTGGDQVVIPPNAPR